jgi:hypothetical protein
MNIEAKFAGLEVGYDVPAIPGMSEDEIQTPCLILDLDALERNIRKMGELSRLPPRSGCRMMATLRRARGRGRGAFQGILDDVRQPRIVRMRWPRSRTRRERAGAGHVF